tara:strand:- start:216 stop:446 length:231 start_codon:yes stop_codon:yes gene_type:complete
MNKKKIKLDLIGLKCPLPVLKTAKKIKEINNESLLEIKTDDPSAENDIEELCRNNNYKVLQKLKEKKVLYFVLKKN